MKSKPDSHWWCKIGNNLDSMEPEKVYTLAPPNGSTNIALHFV